MRERASEMAEEWHILGSVIDRLLFWISLAALLAFTAWMTLNSLRSPHLSEGAVLVTFGAQKHQRDD